MKHVVYFFSGTGNSIAVVKEIEKTGAKALSITALKNKEESCDAEKIGFVCPTYYLGLPEAVHKFVEKLHMPNAKYIYLINTMGWGMKGGSIKQMKQHLAKKNLKLSMGNYIHMPMNDFTYAKVHNESKQKKILEGFDKAINRIISDINNEKCKFSHEPVSFMVVKQNIPFCDAANAGDKNFTVTDACTGCGICSKVCGNGNIVIKDGKPEWQHSCQMCFGCFHYCPQKAICYNNKGKEITHYHHPDCSAAVIEEYHKKGL